MSQTWRNLYTKMIDFIASHNEIKIEPSTIRVPKPVRPVFSQLFWDIREAFIKETNDDLLNEAQIISKNYLQIEDEIVKLIGLERIFLFPPLDNFLHNPKDTLIKSLRYPFYELLKDRISIYDFENKTSASLISTFDSFYQQGYETWMILALIKLLEADSSLRVDTSEFDDDEYFAHGPGGSVEVPVPKEWRSLSFRYNLVIGLLVPHQIIHSARHGTYFSFRSYIGEPEGEVDNRSTEREWLPLPVKTIENMSENIFLVYADKKSENLSVIGEKRYICRPDLIIESIGVEKLFNEKSLANAKKYNEDLKPKLGTYIVSNRPLMEGGTADREIDIILSEQAIENLSKEDMGIHFLPTGFNQSKLKQIVNLFKVNKK